MWIDIAVLVLFLGYLIDGYRRGFVKTGIDTFGWIISLVLAFVWYKQAADFVRAHTGIDESILNTVSSKISQSTAKTASEFLNFLPTSIFNMIKNTGADLTNNLASTLTSTLFNIFAFVAVVFLIRIAFVLLASLITRGNDTTIGGFDKFLGIFAGALKGSFVIFFLLALLVGIIGVSHNEFLIGHLSQAPFTKFLYDHNLIFIAVKSVL